MAGLNFDGTEVKSLRIAGNQVTDVTRDSAQVGCTKVTRAEAEALLAKMNDAANKLDFHIEVPAVAGMMASEWFNLTIASESYGGWFAASEDARATYYGTDRGFRNRFLAMCVRRSDAEKLCRFLGTQLGLRFQTAFNPSGYIKDDVKVPF